MKQIKLSLYILLLPVMLSAQTITFDFSYHKEKPLTVTLNNGTASDTVFSGKTGNTGTARVTIGQEYASYTGMASVNIGQSNFDFIAVPKENPLIRCSEQYVHGGNTTFEDSPENESLQSWFMSQAVRRQKIGLLSELERTYDKEDAFFPLLEKEKSKLQGDQSAFEKELKASPLYAARFIRYHNFLNGEVGRLVFGDSLQQASVRRFVRDSLDINGLFTSGLWFPTLNGLLALYDNDTPYHKDFITDMTLLLERAESDRIYTTLAENLFAICESTGWNDLEEQLAYYLINSGRIENPTGKLKMLMTLFKLGKGSKVPELTQGKLPSGKVLLVFYETGCGPCENEMQQLKGNYPLLQERGYEVVSVSADADADVFQNTAETFPWKDKYCDLKGIGGDDFKNFGIIGTPTFYVIEGGIVQGRYARLEDTGVMKNEELRSSQ